MVKSRLAKLEKAVGEIRAGVRCPTCCCTDGDGRTGRWRVLMLDDDGKLMPDESEQKPWWTPDGRCPTCGTELATITIETMGATMGE